jgi:hypothetical protein
MLGKIADMPTRLTVSRRKEDDEERVIMLYVVMLLVCEDMKFGLF